MRAQIGVTTWEEGSPKGHRVPAGEGLGGGDSEVAEEAVTTPGVRVASLDTVVLVCKLLIIETKLIHEGGCHLLDLVLGESLGETALQGRPQPPGAPRVLTTRGGMFMCGQSCLNCPVECLIHPLCPGIPTV